MKNMIEELSIAGIIQALQSISPQITEMLPGPQVGPTPARPAQPTGGNPMQGSPRPLPPGVSPPSPGQPMGVASAPNQMGPPQAMMPSMPSIQQQVEYNKAADLYQRRSDGQNGFERFVDSIGAPAAMERLTKAQRPLLENERAYKQRVLQQNADAIYSLARKMGAPDAQAREMATVAMMDEEAGRKILGQLMENQAPTEMGKDVEAVMNMPEGPERDFYMELLRNKGTTRVTQMPWDYIPDPNDPSGISVIPRPGTAEWLEREEKLVKERQKYDDQIYNITESIGQLKQTMDLTDPTTTGLMGWMTGGIPGTRAKALRSRLLTQQAKAAFTELYNMRQASVTGGALGNVSNREIELLYSAWTALDADMSDEQLSRSLNDFMMKLERMKFTMEMRDDPYYKRLNEDGKLSRQEVRQLTNDHVNELMRKNTYVTDADWAEIQKQKNNPAALRGFANEYGWVPSFATDGSWEGLQGLPKE